MLLLQSFPVCQQLNQHTALLIDLLLLDTAEKSIGRHNGSIRSPDEGPENQCNQPLRRSRCPSRLRTMLNQFIFFFSQLAISQRMTLRTQGQKWEQVLEKKGFLVVGEEVGGFSSLFSLDILAQDPVVKEGYLISGEF